MDEGLYKSLLEQSPVGYAYHRILCDDQGKPVDYEFLEVNAAFEAYTGLRGREIIGKRVTQVLPGIERQSFDWIGYYGDIALNGGKREFEQYAEPLRTWYRVNVMSHNRGFFVTYFVDISRERNQLEELSNFFEVNLDLLCIADTEGHFLKVNKEWERVLGYSAEELLQRKFLDLVHPEDIQSTVSVIETLKDQKPVLDFVNRYTCKDGSYRWLEWRSHPRGKLIYAAARDITQRIQSEKELRAREEQYRLLAENSADVIWVMNMATMRYVYISPSIMQLRGYTVEEALSQSFEESLTAESARCLRETEERTQSVRRFLKDPDHPELQIHEIQQPCKNGEVIWVETSTKFRLNAQNEVECVGTSRNIEARKNVERQILYLSYRDQLTGLYNRRYLEEEIKRLDSSRNLPVSIILADIDGLKQVNDRHGHEKGDELIIKAAAAIKSSCRPEDLVSRWGGDEFVVLLSDTSRQDAEKIVQRIHLCCGAQSVNGTHVGISIGFGTKERMDQPILDILRQADDAMYRVKAAKRAGSGM